MVMHGNECIYPEWSFAWAGFITSTISLDSQNEKSSACNKLQPWNRHCLLELMNVTNWAFMFLYYITLVKKEI